MKTKRFLSALLAALMLATTLLSGVILSLLGQGLPPLEAAAGGAWLHGAAGDLAAKRLGEYGMLPSDLVEELPRLLK